MRQGLFITMEGPDKAGKSTQVQLLYQYLKQKNIDVVLTREPGGSEVGEKIRNVILSTEHDMGDICEAMLYAASRAEHVRTVIKPALQAGKCVLCDRYVDSSIAYQGYGRALGHAYVEALNKRAVDGILPEITLFLYMDPKQAIQRVENHTKDRLEITDDAFRERVMEGYLKIEKENSDRYHRIDAARSKESVHQDIIAVVNKWI